MSKPSRLKRVAIGTAAYLSIIVVTLGVTDLALIGLGLFPPTPDPGDPYVGWWGGSPTGSVRNDVCTDLVTKEAVLYRRNEDGLRTSFSAARLTSDSMLIKVAATGDSHTELCFPNETVHFGVLEKELTAAGRPAAVFAYGAGKYSPLQAYLAVRGAVRNYEADALVLNFYTGNDFHDMLRVDDRPYFTLSNSGYEIADPVWFQLDAPDARPRSRVLFALRAIGDRTGIRRVLVRVRYLRAAPSRQGASVLDVLTYMNRLRRGVAPEVEYSAAFIAQMLNQQLFFYSFPGSREESVRRVEALMELIREENPDVLLVMSPIPSYQLVQEQPVDQPLLDVLDKLPLTYEGGVAEEQGLYDELKRLASEQEWVFVDNLAGLRGYGGPTPLYNKVDYHIDPNANEIIGRLQAAAIEVHVAADGSH